MLNNKNIAAHNIIELRVLKHNIAQYPIAKSNSFFLKKNKKLLE